MDLYYAMFEGHMVRLDRIESIHEVCDGGRPAPLGFDETPQSWLQMESGAVHYLTMTRDEAIKAMINAVAQVDAKGPRIAVPA